MSERAVGICAELIRRRVVPREELLELEEDLVLREEVSRRLIDVGLTLLNRPGVSSFGVVVAEPYRSGETLSDHGLDSRALGLLLYLWLRLVAPRVYGEERTLTNDAPLTISADALLEELPGNWKKTTLAQYLGRLRRLKFIEGVRGEEAWSAGPMLWLAIDHDQLSEFLRREKGLPQAVERYLRQAQKESGES